MPKTACGAAILVLSWLTAISLALTGCSNARNAATPALVNRAEQGAARSPNPELPAPQLAQLPLPAQLELPAHPRQASYIEADLSHTGSEYATSLFNQRVAVQADTLEFSPQWSEPGGSFDQLAIALYVFHASGYERKPQLRTTWGTPPADAASVWYGLANWDKNRWDFFPATADYLVEPASFDPYLNFSGDLVAAVIRTGTDASTLDTIRLAAPLPIASLTATPAQGNVPLAVTLDASGSTAAEGSLMRYEFDPEGDGTFIDNGTATTYEFTYDNIGMYDAQVRIIDSQDATATAIKQVRATGPWTHTYHIGDIPSGCQISGLAVSPAGEIYACGFSLKTGQPSRATVWKYSAIGDLLWVKSTGSDFSSDIFDKCALDSDGNLVLCGRGSNADGVVANLQKWTPGGEVLWSRSFAGEQQAYLHDVALLGTEIYAVGSYDNSVGDSSPAALRVSPAGELVWARRWNLGPGNSGTMYSAVVFSRFDLDTFELLAGGYCGPQDINIPLWEPSPVLLGFDENGNLIRSYRLGDGSYRGMLEDVAIKGLKPFDTRIVTLGYHSVGSSNDTYVISTNFAGEVTGSALYSEPGTSVSPCEFSFVAGVNGVLVAATLFNGVNNFGSLLGLDPATGTEGPEYYWDSTSAGSTAFTCVKTTTGGVVIGGALRSADPPGSRGGMGGSAGMIDQAWYTVAGTNSEAFINLYSTGLTSTDVTEGVLDDASIVTSAMVRYEPF